MSGSRSYLSRPAFTVAIPDKVQHTSPSLEVPQFPKFAPKAENIQPKFNYNSLKQMLKNNSGETSYTPFKLTFKLRNQIQKPINVVYCKDPMNSFPNIYANKYQVVPYFAPFKYNSEYPPSRDVY